MSTTRSATINSRRDGELLGQNASSNGRSCEQHECCGKAVKADDVIRFKLAVVGMFWASHWRQSRMSLSRTAQNFGREVAALPSQWSKYIDKFAQVLELYSKTIARAGIAYTLEYR